MKQRIRRYVMQRILVRVFAEVSTSNEFASKEASTITLFDAVKHYAR